MTEQIIRVLEFIAGGGAIAFLTFLITAKQIRREYELKNESSELANTNSSIGILKEVTEELKDTLDERNKERERAEERYDALRTKNENLQEENTAVKMFMCIHLGCALRKPMAGQGDKWYQTHRDDPSLGADFLPINQLLRKYGREKDD